MRRILRVVGSLVAFLMLCFIPLTSAQAYASPTSAFSASVFPTSTSSSEKVLFIGMTGIDINAVDFNNSVISSFLSRSALSNMTARSVPLFTCPSEGWMALATSSDAVDKAGREKAEKAEESEDRCTPITLTSSPGSGIRSAEINDFAERTSAVTWPSTSAYRGSLAIGTGAALSLADSSGKVEQWTEFTDDVATLTALFNSAQGSVFIDIGGVRAQPGTPEYKAQVAQIMTRLARVIEASEASQVQRNRVVASLGDPWNSGTLQFVAFNIAGNTSPYKGLESGVGVLRSSSTRATGLISIADMRGFLQGKGNPLTLKTTDTAEDARAEVSEFTKHSYAARQANSDWYRVFNLVVILGAVVAIALFLMRPAPSKKPWGASEKLWRIVSTWNTWAFAFIPAAFILNFTHWWDLPIVEKGSASSLVAVLLTIAIAALITAFAHLTPSPVGTVAFIALAILCLDVIAGSTHQRNGFMGSLVLTSRRFYGISNRTYLVLIVAGLLATLPWLLRKNRERSAKAGVVIAALGAVVLFVDAVPAWGADFGGPPGIIAAFGTASLLVAGIRLRWWHAGLWLVLTAATMGIMGLIDSRTGTGGSSHIGRFWASLGTSENVEIVMGKIRDVLRSFTGRPSTIFTLAAMAIVAILALVAMRALEKRSGVHASSLKEATSGQCFRPLALAAALGILVAIPVNDSGALMLKEGLYIGLPAFISLMAYNLASRKDTEGNTEESDTRYRRKRY